MKLHSSKFQLNHLYRKCRVVTGAAFVVALAIASSWFTPARLRAQSKKQTGPRALAVLAWSGDSPTPDRATAVLEPVEIYVEQRFYDATVYQNDPEPLAVEPGVVYDVLRTGDPIGTFTLGVPRQQGDTWYGLGRYDAKGAVVAKATKPAPAPKSSAENPDDRPRLRRGTPPPAAPKAQTDAVLSTIDRDPERPTLHRHTAADDKKPAAAPEPTVPTAPTHMLAAISTESGPEYRSFKFHDKPGELEKMQASMEKLVRAELDKGRKEIPATQKPERKRTGGSPARSHATSLPAADLKNVKFGVYDVNSDNAPILVYSATATVDGEKKYITVAAWEEIDQSLRKVFAQITDDKHLDVYPRLEVIDAVDARGNERGELLFRAFGDQGTRFILYHPGPDSLEVLFDSAKGGS